MYAGRPYWFSFRAADDDGWINMRRTFQVWDSPMEKFRQRERKSGKTVRNRYSEAVMMMLARFV